jgi:hypothetical protein
MTSAPRARSLLSSCFAVALAAAVGGACSASTTARSTGQAGAPGASPDADASDLAEAGGGQGYDSQVGVNPGGQDATTGCVPQDVPGYAPAWHPPNPPRVACVGTDLEDLLASCFGPAATQADCDAFQAARPQCWSCMISSDVSPTWGPIIASSLTPFYYGNFAGCLALQTGDQSATGCGALQQATRVCSELACVGPSCPAITQPQIAQIAQCVADATKLVCAKYHDPELACVQGLLNGGGVGAAAVHYCSQTTYGDELGFLRALGLVSCAPPGGIDGGSADAALGPGDAATSDGGGTD